MRRLNTKNRERADEVTVWARFYAAARANFLLVFVLTILNMVLRLTGNGLYFPFSASLPTYFIDFAISLGGHPILLAIAVVLGAIPLVFYLIAFLFSKKMRLGWMIAGIVVSVLDTLVLVLGYVLSSVLIDLLFHLWIFGSQVLGLVAAIYLSHLAKALPPPDAPVLPDTQTEEAEGEMPNSPVLRPADMSVRARKLLSAELNGHHLKMTFESAEDDISGHPRLNPPTNESSEGSLPEMDSEDDGNLQKENTEILLDIWLGL